MTISTFTFSADEVAVLLDALQNEHDNQEEDLGEIPPDDAFYADKVAHVAQLRALLDRLGVAITVAG